MSAAAGPIPPHRFAEAIQDLPVGNLHLKSAEIRNSISHLQSSNDQLQEFADEGDTDCAEALRENREVMQRMEERIALLKSEVERRGFMWGESDDTIGRDASDGVEKMNGQSPNGHAGRANEASRQGVGRNEQPRLPPGRNISGDELARQSAERMEEGDTGDDGLHL